MHIETQNLNTMYGEEALVQKSRPQAGAGRILEKASDNGVALKKQKEKIRIKNDLLVFLVDDDRFFLNTLYYFLTDSLPPQIRIKTFTTAEECIEAMHEKPNIVVLDYFLSSDPSGKGMDGLSALKKINQASAETFVIILSAQDNIDVALQTLKEGAYDYLSKSETAFIRLKTMIRNIAETVSQNKERDKEEIITKRINLLVILILIALFIISRIVN